MSRKRRNKLNSRNPILEKTGIRPASIPIAGQEINDLAKPAIIPPGYIVVTAFEFAKKMYAHFGKGIVSYPGAGRHARYVVSESLLTEMDKSFLDSYNPSSEFVITYPFSENNPQGVWVTTIIKFDRDDEACLRIMLPDPFLADDEKILHALIR